MQLEFINKILNKGSARTIMAKKNIFAMFIIKGLNISINLLMVPLLINALNPEKYGVWLTISSIVTLLSFFDVGIGHGLRNKLTETIAKNDIVLARTYISTAYIFLGFFITIFISLYLSIDRFINWINLLNAPYQLANEINLLMKFVIILFCLNLFFKLITSIMYAFQIPAFANLVILLGQTLTLVVIVLMLQFGVNTNLFNLGVVLMSSPVLVLVTFTVVLFRGKYKRFSPKLSMFNKKLFNNIFVLGISFFLVQITSVLIFQTNNLVTAHLLGPEMVTEYNIAYKYLGLTTMAFSIITTPFWSATTDAFAKNDFDWIKKSVRTLNKIWILFSVLGIVLLFSSKFVYKIWLGEAISADFYILIPMLIYNIIQMRWFLYGSILNGMGKIRLQLIVTGIETLIHIPLAIFLGKKFGITGIIMSMILMSFANTIWPVIQYEKNLEGDAKGIWIK